jgi:hypothetical protein
MQPLAHYLTEAITPQELAAKLDNIAFDYAKLFMEHPAETPQGGSENLEELRQLRDVLNLCQ